jgi:hypothetical protein
LFKRNGEKGAESKEKAAASRILFALRAAAVSVF